MAFIERLRTYCGGNRSLAWLLVATVAAGLLLWILSAACRLSGHSDAWITEWMAVPASPMLLLTRPWALLTYMAAHLSPLHLLFNTLWLYWFGRMLGDVARDRFILTLFLGGGIAGALVYVVTALLSGYPPEARLTGDSAAVLSVMTAAAFIMPNRRIGLFLFGEVKLKWIAIVCIAITLVGANGTGIPPQAAHFAGIAFGIAAALNHKGALKTGRRGRERPKSRGRRKMNVNATLSAMSTRIPDEERLDQLLDKIRVSGYDALSAREKTELNHISSRLEKQTNKK